MNSVFHRSGRPSSRRGRGGLICAVFLAAAFLFAGAGPAEAAKHADLKGSTLELFKAVALNDMAGVKKSIDDGADLYAENEEGMSAADLAVDKGHFIVAHYLLSRRLAEQTPPVALVPGKAKEAHKAAKSRPKRKFAAPPPKPPAPPPMDTEETIAEIPPAEAEDKPTETASEAQQAQAAPEAPEAPEPSAKPLAGEGPVSFFESLVDLITPGGGKPPPRPEDAAKVADANGTPGGTPGAEPEETIVEAAVEQPDEIVEQPDEIIIDVTGDVTGDELDGDSHFRALCKDTLYSHKQSEGAGGSYGVGKSVLWAFSGLSTVLFNSVLSKDPRGFRSPRLIGRAELPSHGVSDESWYSGPGWFGIRADVTGGARAESVWADAAALLASELCFE
ncbi:MAG: ankyrin repeat domain-containing protein, partial [Proteobacteria bacterium]|nr:ankyrin repeat domain-containing protein [Pseudomonadota bacterium]